MARHSKGVKKGLFCSKRTRPTQKCSCNNQYRDNCKPNKGWSDYFLYDNKVRIGVDVKYEAHHVICIASVTKEIGKNNKIIEIVKNTKWCINKKENMYAMPLWGHTIKWYFNIEASGENARPPNFENIPCHNYDHNSAGGYTDEVDQSMKDIADQIEAAKDEKHEAPEGTLNSQLNAVSEYFRGELERRGSRNNGTHKSWDEGSKGNAQWYIPFSMSNDGRVNGKSFPIKKIDRKIINKIKKAVASFTGGH